MTEYTPQNDSLDDIIERLEYEKRLKNAKTDEELETIRRDVMKMVDSVAQQLSSLRTEKSKLDQADTFQLEQEVERLTWESENLKGDLRNQAQEIDNLNHKLLMSSQENANLVSRLERVVAKNAEDVEKYKRKAERYMNEYEEFRRNIFSQKSLGKSIEIQRGRGRKKTE